MKWSSTGDQLVVPPYLTARATAASSRPSPPPATATIWPITTVKARANGKPFGKAEFSGKRTPPVPPAPDLLEVKFGDPIVLFDGKDLDGWELTDPHAANGWSVKDGVLNNNPAKRPVNRSISAICGQSRNSRTSTSRPKPTCPNGNSGVYLRGIYEVQVLDSYGKTPDPHNMGAIYSRISPPNRRKSPPANGRPSISRWWTGTRPSFSTARRSSTTSRSWDAPAEALWSDPLRPGPISLPGRPHRRKFSEHRAAAGSEVRAILPT